MATRRSYRGNSSSRRRTVWAYRSSIGTSATSAAIDLLSGYRAEMGISANTPGVTAGPVIGAINIVSTDIATTARATMGIRRADMANIPIGSADSPNAEPFSDWMWMAEGVGSSALTNFAFTDPRTGASSVGGIPIHTRSKRKLDEPNQTLVLLADFSVDATVSVVYSVWTRTLITLP